MHLTSTLYQVGLQLELILGSDSGLRPLSEWRSRGERSGDSWRASPPGRFRLRTAFERARHRPQTKTAARILWQLSPLRGASRIRTGDPLLAKQVLYQLSYNPGDVPGPWGRGEGTKKAGLASGL